MVAEWGPLFRRRVIQPGFFCSFLLQCIVPPTFLYVTAVSDSHSHQLLRHLHPTTSVPALYAHFLELWQSAQSVPSFRFLAQILCTGRFFHGFCCAFLVQCIVPPMCLCCSVCQPQRRAKGFEKLTGQKFSRQQRVFLRVCGRVDKDGVYIRVTYIYAYCIARIQYSTRLLGGPPTGSRRPCRRRE